jgi:hypothetical protein
VILHDDGQVTCGTCHTTFTTEAAYKGHACKG